MYDKDYLVYDDYGLKEVRCMRCDTVVKRRETVEHKAPNGVLVNVFVMKTLSNFVPIPYILNDNSYTNILLCKDCAKKHDGTETEKDGMIAQFKKGHVLEATAAKRTPREIDDMKKRMRKLKVFRMHDFDREHRENSKSR